MKIEMNLYNLALGMVVYNHNQNDSDEKRRAILDQLTISAKHLGYDIRESSSGYLLPYPRYSEKGLELDKTMEFIESTKKHSRGGFISHYTTPFAVRHENRDARKDARWYNVTRYMYQGRCIYQHKTPATYAKETARNLRRMKTACECQKADDIAYWAEVLTDSMRNMRKEAAARMTYPEQVTYDLNGNPINPELPF